MIRKYQEVFNKIYQTIDNLIMTGMKPEAIATHVYNQYPSFIRFYDVSKDMQIELLISIAEQAWYMKYKNFDFR